VELNIQRVALSSISLRHLPLAEALAVTQSLGFELIDLGALPGVCDHVPYDLDTTAVDRVVSVIAASGLNVQSVNADIGDLNRALTAFERLERDDHLARLVELTAAIGARALVLPNGRLNHEPIVSLDDDLARAAAELADAAEVAEATGVQLWVEAPHSMRFAFDIERSARLYELLPSSIGAVLDVSHIIASGGTPREFLAVAGERLAHVHLRDAEPGYIHHSIGKGQVDFPDMALALADLGYTGALALELETRDIDNADRGAEALRAGQYISELLAQAGERMTTSIRK
jgi:sugar phosphate isomerase/epimerase